MGLPERKGRGGWWGEEECCCVSGDDGGAGCGDGDSGARDERGSRGGGASDDNCFTDDSTAAAAAAATEYPPLLNVASSLMPRVANRDVVSTALRAQVEIAICAPEPRLVLRGAPLSAAGATHGTCLGAILAEVTV